MGGATSQNKQLFEDYDGFVEKFKPKKTTDDCYTPPEVYDVIKDWACKEYGIDPDKIVRPFYPGGDYESFDYSGGKVVLDNPPFSILSDICDFYKHIGVKFFIFEPTLTAFSTKKKVEGLTHVITDCTIVYENGAKVPTSFVTNMSPEIVAKTSPDLTEAVNEIVDEITGKSNQLLPRYSYPSEVISPSMLQRWAKYGVFFEAKRGSCVRVSGLDNQNPLGKTIFGGGLLLSRDAAKESARAESEASSKSGDKIWTLSDRERAIVDMLGKR